MVPATIMQIRIIIFFLVIKGSVSLVWVWTKRGPGRDAKNSTNYVSYIVILKFLKMQSIGQEVMSAPEKQGAEEELRCKMSIKTLSQKVKDGEKNASLS